MNTSPFIQKNWATLLAFLVACICLFLTFTYANQPLLEAHDFRQTQTALSAYWMKAEGWRLDYQTPVVGYPWAIPFEFPIYQSIVVAVSNLFKLPLDATGRIISAIFLLAIAWPARRIAKHFNAGDEVTWIFCALLWSSPLYLFWGRSFMIETAGVFLTLAAAAYLLPLNTKRPLFKNALIACLFGGLALLQKVTTALPVMAVIGVWTFYHYAKKQPLRAISVQQWLSLLIAYGLPIIFMQVWTSYSDTVKSANEFGKTLTSSSLLLWNFGTLKQRLTPSIYVEIFGIRIFHHNVVSVVGFLVIVGSLFFSKKGVKRAVFFCLLLGALPILIFFNLHFCHTYYQMACTVFFIAALAIATTFWLPQLSGKRWLLPLCVLLFVGFNYGIFFTHSYGHFLVKKFTPANDTTLAVSKVIEENVAATDAIIVFGKDWSSSVAYYSQRKAFTVPDKWCEQTTFWQRTPFILGDRKVGGVVCLPNACVGLKDLLQKPEVKVQPRIFPVFGGYLWLPNAKVVKDPMTNKDVYPLSIESLAVPHNILTSR